MKRRPDVAVDGEEEEPEEDASPNGQVRDLENQTGGENQS